MQEELAKTVRIAPNRVPRYSPDLRKAFETEPLWSRIGERLDSLPQKQCKNYFEVCIFKLSFVHLQRRNESLLRNLDLAELPHLLLARLLLL